MTYAQAIQEALDLCLEKDSGVFVVGEGVPDPKGIFGTTLNLPEKYGKQRVMDMPVSENALTGVCIGAALRGMRPVMTHQRVDFSFLALDQIINNAAKWHFMFGGQADVPLVIRLIIGRGWGQGAQHSQSLQALYAHIPGLKVIMPATPCDAKGMMIAAVQDNNPVICLEHRWLSNISDHVPQGFYEVPLGQAKVIKEGNDVTIVTCSYMTIEAIKACRLLEDQGIYPEVIDLRTIKPMDMRLIRDSVQKTGRLIVADLGWKTGGIAAEVVAGVAEECFSELKEAPRRICLKDIPTPSSPALTKEYYPGAIDIIKSVMESLKKNQSDIDKVLQNVKSEDKPHDVPDSSFTGPF